MLLFYLEILKNWRTATWHAHVVFGHRSTYISPLIESTNPFHFLSYLGSVAFAFDYYLLFQSEDNRKLAIVGVPYRIAIR